MFTVCLPTWRGSEWVLDFGGLENSGQNVRMSPKVSRVAVGWDATRPLPNSRHPNPAFLDKIKKNAFVHVQ